MSAPAALAPTTCAPYETAAVDAPNALENLYRDTFESFGWTVTGTEQISGSHAAVRLIVRREWDTHNRTVVLELQRVCEEALASIHRLERLPKITAIAAAGGLGFLGAGSMVGAIFLSSAAAWPLATALGVLGLLSCASSRTGYHLVKAWRSMLAAPALSEQYEIVDRLSHQGRLLVSGLV